MWSVALCERHIRFALKVIFQRERFNILARGMISLALKHAHLAPRLFSFRTFTERFNP